MADANILVVDDEPEVCELLADWLAQDGQWTVDYTTEPSRALEQVGVGGYDLLITDLRMPGMSGLDLARQVRNLHPDIPVIAITGYASVDSSVEALRLGVDDYLQKPFRGDDVRSAVFRALAQRTPREPMTEDDADEVTHANAVLAARNEELEKRIELISRELVSMQHRLSGAVTDLEARCNVADVLEGERDVERLMATSLMILRSQLPADEHIVALLSRKPARSTAVASVEGDDIVVRWAEQPLTPGILRAVMKRWQPALIEDISRSAVLGNVKSWIEPEGALLVLPIVGNGRIQAVVLVRRAATGLAFGTTEVRRLLPICAEIGRAFEIAVTLQHQQSHTFSCLKAIADGIDDTFHAGEHSRRVAECVADIGRRLRLPQPRLDVLHTAARLHDIGKVTVLPGLKALGLDADAAAPADAPSDDHGEHAERGWMLLRPLQFLRPAARLIRGHHDLTAAGRVRLLDQQILAAAELYDELTHDAPNGGTATHLEAIAEMRRRSDFGDEVLNALSAYSPVDA